MGFKFQVLTKMQELFYNTLKCIHSVKTHQGQWHVKNYKCVQYAKVGNEGLIQLHIIHHPLLSFLSLVHE